MSLINDALKKAQQQREKPPGAADAPAPAPAAAAPAPAPSAPARRASGRTFSLLIVGGCALIAVSVATTVYLLRRPAEAPRPSVAAVASSSPAASAVPAATPLAPPPAASAPAQTAPSGSSAGPVAAASIPTGATAPAVAGTPTPTPAVAALSQPKSAEPASTAPAKPAASEPAARPAVSAPAPTPDAAPVKLTYRIQGMIDKFRISGIRLAGTESKVILNEHLFRQDDLIEPSLGLRLTRIESHALTFTDAEGNTYVKRF